jgi:hypothetical protein
MAEHVESGRPTAEMGTIRAVLYWAKPNPLAQNPYPAPTKQAAYRLCNEFAQPVAKDDLTARYLSCVRLGEATETGVLEENNLRVIAVDGKMYTFIFRFAHPGK